MSAEMIRFEVQTSIYPLEAAQAAAYVFTDRAHVEIKQEPGGSILVELKPRPEAKKSRALRSEFLDELLHQALRLKISASNQKIREYIVTQALLSAQPAEDVQKARAQASEDPILDDKLEQEIEDLLAEVEKESAGKDPLKIAIPWEDGSQRSAAPAPKQDLESEVEKLLDHAEKESKVSDPAGSPVAYEALARKTGKKAVRP